MKITRSSVIAALATVTVCTGLLALAGILLLPAELASPEQSVHENISGVGYSDYPASRGLLFTDQEGRGAFIYLDFENIVTQVHIFSEDAEAQAEKLPYLKHYTFRLPEGFAAALCDRLGGIEMTDDEGANSLYFSTALTQFCQKDMSYDKMLKISLAFFKKIAKIGLSSEDFMFIIELTETDLTYSVCYDWIPHIREMFCNCIIN